MEKFADLGCAAVLDAERLVVGSTVDIDGRILVVKKIEGISVFFRPLTKWELVKYHWSGKLTATVIFGTLFVVGLFWWIGH